MSDPDDSKPNTDIVPTVESVLGQAAEKYAANTQARAFLLMLTTVMQAIPGVGQFFMMWGVLDLIASNRGQEIQAERTKRLIESLGREVAGVREEMLRREYFESEEWHDLFRRALEANARVRDDQRRDAIVRILVAAATGNVPPEVEPESFVAVIAEMSEGEAAVLGVLWAKQQQGFGPFTKYHEWENEVLPASVAPRGLFLLRRLVGRGLLDETLEIESGDRGNSRREYVHFTPTGAALLRYLEASPSSQVDAPPNA